MLLIILINILTILNTLINIVVILITILTLEAANSTASPYNVLHLSRSEVPGNWYYNFCKLLYFYCHLYCILPPLRHTRYSISALKGLIRTLTDCMSA